MSLEKKITTRLKPCIIRIITIQANWKHQIYLVVFFSLFLSHANILNNINRPFLDSDRKTVHKILTTNDLSMRFAKRRLKQKGKSLTIPYNPLPISQLWCNNDSHWEKALKYVSQVMKSVYSRLCWLELSNLPLFRLRSTTVRHNWFMYPHKSRPEDYVINGPKTWPSFTYSTWELFSFTQQSV